MNTIISEMTENGEVFFDVYQKLASSRVLFLNSEITEELATDIIATLLVLDNEKPGEKITLFINSMGGHIRNILMIYDAMQILSSPIETLCIGSCFDEAVLLLSSGTPGMRFATKNAAISVGPLLNDFRSHGNLTDAAKLLELNSRDSKAFIDILAKGCKKTVKEFSLDFDKREFLNPKQAMKYGFIDKIV